MIKRFRLPRLVRFVIGFMLLCALITGGVVYGRRSGANGYACLAVLDSSGNAVELLEIHTGARYTFRREVTPWVDLTLRRTSPDGKYVAQIQSLGSRKYTLVVTETANDKITTSQANLVTAPDPSDYGYHDIVWSPDSSRLALVWSHRPPQERFIVTLKLDGTDLQRRDNVTFLHGWSIDGQNLAVSLAAPFQGFNRPLYLWSLSAAKLTIVSRSGYEPIAAVWSPTHTHLAFVERPAGNLQGAAWLGIASAAGGTVIRLALPSAVQQVMARLLWSPDGRYLVVMFDAQGQTMLSLIDAGKGATLLQTPINDKQTMQLPQLWLENSRVLMFVRSDTSTNWVKYYLDENRYEIIVPDIQDISRTNSPYSGKVVVSYAHDGMSNVGVIDTDGTNFVPLIEQVDGRPFFERSPDGKALAILWSKYADPARHLTWITADRSEPHTLAENFQGDVVVKWVDGSKAIIIFASGGARSGVHLIKTGDGSQQTLFTGKASLVTLYSNRDAGQYDGFLRQDEQGNSWIDAYDANGQRIYHLQTNSNPIQTGIVLPDGKSVALITRMRSQTQQYDLSISSADGQWSRTIRSGMSILELLMGSPDGKMLAFEQIAAGGIQTIEIINPDGASVGSFGMARSVGWSNLRWATCDSHE
jgi:Tol biopolymer transport system component